ncbi:S-layer homology domain-containing protein [Arthrobacter sp. TMT4-20]
MRTGLRATSTFATVVAMLFGFAVMAPASHAAEICWIAGNGAVICQDDGSGGVPPTPAPGDGGETLMPIPDPAPGPGRSPFKDVATSNMFYGEISWAVGRGITTGWSDKTFRPLEATTREAVAAFLYRLAGSPEYTAPKTPRFKDVPRSHPFYTEISWLAEEDISTGWSDRTFRPGLTTNRDAMATFLYRMAGEPKYVAAEASPFRDINQGTLYYKEMSWLADYGISTGWEDNTFRPLTTTNRDAMAAFLFRFHFRFLL